MEWQVSLLYKCNPVDVQVSAALVSHYMVIGTLVTNARNTQTKHTRIIVVSNEVLCLWPMTLLSFDKTHETIIGKCVSLQTG